MVLPAHIMDAIGYDYGEPWCHVHDAQALTFSAGTPIQCARPFRAPANASPCQFRPLLVPVAAGAPDNDPAIWKTSAANARLYDHVAVSLYAVRHDGE